MKVKTNPDKEFVNDIKKQLKSNSGYCPCQLEKNQNTKCMCKDFRDMLASGEEGMCICGLYMSVQD